MPPHNAENERFNDLRSVVERASAAEAFENPAAIRAAVNQEIAPHDTIIADSDEVALFPPMTGG